MKLSTSTSVVLMTLLISSIVLTDVSAATSRTRTRAPRSVTQSTTTKNVVTPTNRTTTTKKSTSTPIEIYGVADEYRRNQNWPYEINATNGSTFIDSLGNQIIKTSGFEASSMTHTGDLIINGDITSLSFLTVHGNLMVRGNVKYISNLTVDGNIYIYGDLTSTFVDTPQKIKVLGTYTASSMDANRGYMFGRLGDVTFLDVNQKPYTGYLKRIDPFLKFDLSESEMTEVKRTIKDYESQVWPIKTKLEKEYSDYKSVLRKKWTPKNAQTIKNLKAQLLAIKKEMAADEYLSSMREYDTRDIAGFKQAQQKEIEDTNNYLNSIKL